MDGIDKSLGMAESSMPTHVQLLTFSIASHIWTLLIYQKTLRGSPMMCSSMRKGSFHCSSWVSEDSNVSSHSLCEAISEERHLLRMTVISILDLQQLRIREIPGHTIHILLQISQGDWYSISQGKIHYSPQKFRFLMLSQEYFGIFWPW